LLSCSGCPVLAVLFWLSFSACPVVGVLSWLYIDARAQNYERGNQEAQIKERKIEEREKRA
jgi:hypothetical protein